MTISILALVLIVIGALLLVQLGANALALTGLSQSAARFQAASAFFGVGFTTQEAEMVVNHPVRRRIILYLIVSGNVGITSALATLVVTLMKNDPENLGWGFLLFAIVLSAVAVGLFMNIPFIKRPLDALMKQALSRFGVVKSLDYDVLLRVKDGFSVAEVLLDEEHPFNGRELGDSRPSDHGVVVLGIHHDDGGFVGAPNRDERLKAGDLLMVYGGDDDVRRLRDGYPEER